MRKDDSAYSLMSSAKRLGKLCPVLVDRYGNIIDGHHRLEIDKNWPKLRLEHIGSEEERLKARLVSNVCRRNVTSHEKSEILEKLARSYLKRGVEPQRVAYVIAEELGMSYSWVMRFLPECVKYRPGMGGPSRWFDIEQHKKDLYNYSTGNASAALPVSARWLVSNSSERFVSVRSYGNTSFVSLVIDRHFYDRLKRVCDRAGIATETLINNSITFALRELESIAADQEHAARSPMPATE